MKKGLLIFSILGVSTIALASCGKNENPSSSPSSSSSKSEEQFNALELIKTFDSSINTTIKLTYNANYDMDVNSNGGTGKMDSFKHQIRATTVAEIDLGSDLYIKTTNTRKDLLHDSSDTVTEEILYKKDGKYYYETTSTLAVEVEESKARDKVNEILKNVTSEQAGSIDLSTLIYNKYDRTYFENQLFCSDAILGTDKDDYLEANPTYKKEGTGLGVNYKPEYVGYKTDGGQSDLKHDEYAAEFNVVTNNKGYVTNFNETYNSASLDMHIMTPAPTIILTGSRSFSASYGETLTKATSVTHEASKLSYEASTGGTFVVGTCANGDFTNMTIVSSGADLELGKLVCVKPTASDGKEVKSVSLNGVADTLIEPSKAGGWYCFNVTSGTNTVVVEFKDKTSSEDTKELKFQYTGTANNVAISLNLYKDNTFTVTCPGYGNATAVTGTYTMANGKITLTATSVQYLTKTTDVSELTVSSDYMTLTGEFFNPAYDVTLTYVAQSK